MIHWKTASYNEGLSFLSSIDTPLRLLKTFVSADSPVNRERLLRHFGELVKSGKLDTLEATAAQQETNTVHSHPVVPVVVREKTPPADNPLPELTPFVMEKHDLVNLLVKNHAALKAATSNKERAALMKEQTAIQDKRANNSKNISLIEKGTPPELAEEVRPEHEDIFLIPESKADLIDKKRKLMKTRSQAAANMKKFLNHPEKLKKYTDKWATYDKAVKNLLDAQKKIS